MLSPSHSHNRREVTFVRREPGTLRLWRKVTRPQGDLGPMSRSCSSTTLRAILKPRAPTKFRPLPVAADSRWFGAQQRVHGDLTLASWFYARKGFPRSAGLRAEAAPCDRAPGWDMTGTLLRDERSPGPLTQRWLGLGARLLLTPPQCLE